MGHSYNLTCSVPRANVTTYLWMKDGSVLQGETTETLSIASLTPDDTGWYTCNITVDGEIYLDGKKVIVASKLGIYLY